METKSPSPVKVVVISVVVLAAVALGASWFYGLGPFSSSPTESNASELTSELAEEALKGDAADSSMLTADLEKEALGTGIAGNSVELSPEMVDAALEN